MAVPIAVLIRFPGDAGDLLQRFERARQQWIEAAGDDVEEPIFYAACRTKSGAAILSAWESAGAHRAFGEGISRQLAAVGLPHPEAIEHLRIEKMDWQITG